MSPLPAPLGGSWWPIPALPRFWRFAWLFFMQPFTLHRMLRSLEVDPEESLWKLLRRRRSPQDDWWLLRSAQVFLLFTPGGALIIACLSVWFGAPVNWGTVALGVAVGVAVGVALGAVALGTAIGVLGGVALSTAFGVLGGAARGVPVGLAFGVAVGLPFGRALGVLGVVALGLASVAAFGVVVGVAEGVALGVAFGVASSVAFFAGFLRLPILALEIICQTAARCWSAVTARHTLRWAPVLFHELSYLPHPFLESHILAEADADPDLTRRVLDACSIAPGQRRTGRKVEAKLRARELKRLANAKDFQAIVDLRGTWLPGLQGTDGLLLSFSEAGRYLAAAKAAFNPYHRLKHLEGLAAQLNAIENQLRSKRDVFTQPFEEPLESLRKAGQELRAEAEKNAAGLILNPFRPDIPLSGVESPEPFRGRESVVREIEEILSDPTRSASLQLLAPRRSGKTWLLKTLPRMLPDTVCVFFDLQAHPVDSPGAFWSKLAEQALIQAKLDRRAGLPPLPDGPPMEAAAAWLEKLDQLPNGHRVLLAIDEFERLENLFPGSQREFLQLMGLFRATIQHRRRVRLLVSGTAPFDELDRVWDDHFISARQIKLPFLDEPTSVGLLTQPAPDFPPDAIPSEVACEVYRQTGGQPFLLQVFGALLVSRLNDEKRNVATIDDVKALEGRAIEWAEPYFRDTFKYAPEAAREALGHLARGEVFDLTSAARRWLTQRYLLTPDDRLTIPVFAAWIEHHALV